MFARVQAMAISLEKSDVETKQPNSDIKKAVGCNWKEDNYIRFIWSLRTPMKWGLVRRERV